MSAETRQAHPHAEPRDGQRQAMAPLRGAGGAASEATDRVATPRPPVGPGRRLDGPRRPASRQSAPPPATSSGVHTPANTSTADLARAGAILDTG